MFKRIIGLTGGIGSGKTTVSSYLANKYNLTVLDADIYAREAVAVGSSILTAIFTRYNDDRLMLDDGSLNRTALAEIIFNNSAEKQWLESQIHPYVGRHFEQELRNFKKNTVVLAIPLLFEANFTDLVTEIWVVYCDRPTQIARLQRRDRLTIQQAETRIDNQFPLAEKIKLADVVLDNSGNLQHLTQQIDRAIAIDG
jgi:dephospho-CoA kinase